MVQMFNLPQDPRARLAEQMGLNLGQGVNQVAQQQYQRGLLQQALGKSKATATQPGATPLDSAFALMEAGAGIPGSERYLATLLPLIMQQAGSSQLAQNLPGSVQQTPSETQIPSQTQQKPSETQIEGKFQPTSPGQEKKTADEIDFYSQQYLNQVRPDLMKTGSVFGNVPTFEYELKSDLRPEEESKIRQDLVSKKVSPQIQDQIVNRLREDVRSKYNESLQSYGFDKDKIQAIQNKWSNFRQDALGIGGTPGRLTPYLNKYPQAQGTQDELANHYFKYAQTAPINATPEAMHDYAITQLQNDMNQLDKIKILPSMPPIHTESGVKEAINAYKEPYKELASKGYIKALEEDAIQNKDMGLEELHATIWGDQTNRDTLNKIHSLKFPKGIPTRFGYAGKFSEDYKKSEDKYVKDLSQILRELSPDDDLMLARSMALDNGASVKDFNEALQMAQNGNKPLKLSQFQRGQLGEIQNPRQRPLWELFSADGWKSLINYIRGKK